MSELRQSTTVTLQIGPFVDASDGVTPESGLAGTMTVYISKAGAAFAARNSATAIAYDRDGFYRVELNTTDTNTPGSLEIEVAASATHVPVFKSCMVLLAAFWDAKYAGTGNGVRADVQAIAADVVNASALAADAASEIATAVAAAVPSAATIATAVGELSIVGSSPTAGTLREALLMTRSFGYVRIDGGAGQAAVVYDGDGLATAMRIRVFASEVASAAATLGAADGADSELITLYETAVAGATLGSPASIRGRRA